MSLAMSMMYGMQGVLTAGEDDGGEYRDLHY